MSPVATNGHVVTPRISEVASFHTSSSVGLCRCASAFHRPRSGAAAAIPLNLDTGERVVVECVMTRNEAIRRLKERRADLERLGVQHLYLFGSTARDEAGPDSDVDLFFDHPEGSLGLYQLMDVKEAAAQILGRKTDIMTRRSLHPVLRPRIEASAVQVF